VPNGANDYPKTTVAERTTSLELLASALAGRAVAVAPTGPGEQPWTDGQSIFLDLAAPPARRRAQLAVQAALIAAGSLAPDVIGALMRRPRLAQRYLVVEGGRALLENAYLLPAALSDLIGSTVDLGSSSAEDSLALALSNIELPSAPIDFGTLRPKNVIAAQRTAAARLDNDSAGHMPRRPAKAELEELDDGEVDDTGGADFYTSPVGGGGAIGKWLKKLLASTRGSHDTGGGPPGADAPTHRTRRTNRGARTVLSTASTSTPDEVVKLRPSRFIYPEWDIARKRYRSDWCTVDETVPSVQPGASGTIDDALSVARPLARLGLGLQRRHRQPQGDDIDIDAAIEERLEVRAGSAPDEAVYLDNLRRRRDLSVLLLLDVSGSAAEPGSLGRTVHQQQRTVAAALTVALHDLGDRVALFAYNSQGRQAVNMLPVKRFDEALGAVVLRRLNSLEPGGYSRLGAAIRHGAAVLEADGGTARRLLVVLSDGLAYDHGYERAYGAADARRALTEARRRGTGCICLTVGAGTEVAALRAVFGGAAHATVGRPDQLPAVIGPMFRSAIRSAEVRRRVS